MSTRESGYYWVKRVLSDEWIMGRYDAEQNMWYYDRSEQDFDFPYHITKVNEERLPDPDEQEEAMGKQLEEMHKEYLKKK